jgi:hypothetical protein
VCTDDAVEERLGDDTDNGDSAVKQPDRAAYERAGGQLCPLQSPSDSLSVHEAVQTSAQVRNGRMQGPILHRSLLSAKRNGSDSRELVCMTDSTDRESDGKCWRAKWTAQSAVGEGQNC